MDCVTNVMKYMAKCVILAMQQHAFNVKQMINMVKLDLFLI